MSCPTECYGNVLQHFTGSKDHNIALREEAQRRGLSISEYGVTDVESGEVVTHASEDELYEYLGYRRFRPSCARGRPRSQRRETGTLPDARRGRRSPGRAALPLDLVDGREELARGDGAHREVARATGSSASPTTRTTSATRGSRRSGGDRPAERAAEVVPRLRGIEVNIRADGSLDVDDEVLAELDWVVASVHTSFDRSPTERILGDGQPATSTASATSRGRLLKRDGAPVDVERVVAHAVETGTALEINSQPDRLDMRDTHARLAGEAGVLIPSRPTLTRSGRSDYAELGVAQARRAWLTKEQILNTRSWRDVKKLAK